MIGNGNTTLRHVRSTFEWFRIAPFGLSRLGQCR